MSACAQFDRPIAIGRSPRAGQSKDSDAHTPRREGSWGQIATACENGRPTHPGSCVNACDVLARSSFVASVQSSFDRNAEKSLEISGSAALQQPRPWSLLGYRSDRPRKRGTSDAYIAGSQSAPELAAVCPDQETPTKQAVSRVPSPEHQVDSMVRKSIEARGILDNRILDALRRVPRQAFVPEQLEGLAFDDAPLPIGHGQTISQPYIVALMTEAADPRESDRCLEIGTGSGYQTAILSLLCAEVYSVERIADLSLQAERNLEASGISRRNIHLRHGDGYLGWPEAAPFDLIVVTAAPPKVPQVLLDQLAVRGRLVIPVGEQSSVQRLMRWTRLREGTEPTAFDAQDLLQVRFVPMVNEASRERDD